MSKRLNVEVPSEIGPYSIQGSIGDGAFSEVRLCKKPKTKEYYACKIVPFSRLHSATLEARFEYEIRINQQLHHPGVVQMIDLLRDEKNYYVIMEFCPNGDLFTYIVNRTKLSEAEAKPFARQILEALKYIHSMDVSHRDLKPENILLDQFGHIKISDFGLSKFFNPQNRSLVNTPCGSPCYASPECISGHPYNGKTTDIWSFGVILYAMLTGQLPWTKRNQTQLFQQIKRGEYSIPSYISPEGKNMIRNLMCVNVENRYTIDEALNDPWLKDVQKQFNEKEQNGYVSMKQVDQYFGREISSLNLPKDMNFFNSCANFDFSTTVKAIGGKNTLDLFIKERTASINPTDKSKKKKKPKQSIFSKFFNKKESGKDPRRKKKSSGTLQPPHHHLNSNIDSGQNENNTNDVFYMSPPPSQELQLAPLTRNRRRRAQGRPMSAAINPNSTTSQPVDESRAIKKA